MIRTDSFNFNNVDYIDCIFIWELKGDANSITININMYIHDISSASVTQFNVTQEWLTDLSVNYINDICMQKLLEISPNSQFTYS